jgi:phage gp29-like protein
VSWLDGFRTMFSRGPAKVSDLLGEQGTISILDGARNPVRNAVADTLTAAKLARLMRAADRGDVEAYLTLAEEVEEREGHYRSVLSTRKLGVSGSPVIVKAASDSPRDVEIMEHVEQIVQRPEFEGLVIDLMDAVPKGFSCVEIMWDRDVKRWEPTEYRFRPQRHFVFDTETISKVRLRTAESTDGEDLRPFKWLVHQPKLLSGSSLRSGLARTVVLCYSCKRFTVSEWLAFMEIFGMPIRLGKYPSNMADKKAELQAAVRAIGSDSAGVIPKEMEIELVERKTGGTGGNLFKEAAEYWDEQISKVVLGQTMTSDDGSSLAQSKTHERVRFDIRKADARAVSATINRDLVRALVDLNYGPQEKYPTVSIQAEEPEDTTALMENVKTFVSMGGRVQESEIRDRLGLMEPEDGAECLKPESVVIAAAAPKPEPAEQVGNKPKEGAGKDPAEGDEDIEGAAGSKTELNRARFATQKAAAGDVVDDLAQGALGEWEPMLEGNVGRILSLIANADSYTEARDALDELADDEGEQLALDVIVGRLARETFKTRGLGDDRDDTTP